MKVFHHLFLANINKTNRKEKRRRRGGATGQRARNGGRKKNDYAGGPEKARGDKKGGESVSTKSAGVHKGAKKKERENEFQILE